MQLRKIPTWFLFFLSVLFLGSIAYGQVAQVDGNPCSADRVLFRLKPEFPGSLAGLRAKGALTAAAVHVALGLPAKVRVRAPIMPHPGGVGKSPSQTIEGARFLILDLNGVLEVEAALKELRARPEIEYAEPDWLGSGGATPDDPNYSSQWHLPKIMAPAAWDVTQGTNGVIVAVLDTGLNQSLSEFSGRLVAGYDFANNDSDPTDDYGHGTAVTGTLAANANNATLVAGVDWNCRILPVKVLDASNNGYYSWWAQGIDFAVAQGARVINLSAGGSTSSATLTASIRNAIASGVIFVTITHNDGVGTIRFPGTLPEAITVGATERNDVKTDFSNWGSTIDLVAPGRDIYTVSMNGGITYWWGTSFAAPQVSGAAALLLSVRPSLTQSEVEMLLTLGADDQVGDALDTPGFDIYYGWGRLNLLNTLTLARTRLEVAPVIGTPYLKLSWNAPPNAGTSKPYKVRYSTDLNTWNTIDVSTAITYTAGQAEWIDNGSQTGGPPGGTTRYYQVLVTR